MPEFYFFATQFAGELHFSGPEVKKMNSENVYRLTWVPLAELEAIRLMPPEIKARILAHFGV